MTIANEGFLDGLHSLLAQYGRAAKRQALAIHHGKRFDFLRQTERARKILARCNNAMMCK
jgi:hypothetical protein